MAHAANAQNPLEPVDISIGIQHNRVIIRFISKECTQRSQDSRTRPHTHPYNPLSVTCHFIARIINNVVDNKDKHRHYNRHSQTTFADNSAQRRTDKEEDETCHRKCQFLMPGGHVATQTGICLRNIIALEAPVTPRTLSTVHGSGDDSLFLRQGSYIEKTVYIVISQTCLFYLQCIVFLQVRRNLIRTIHGFLKISTPHTVILHFHGVNAGLQHLHILTIGLIAHDTGIHHIEVGVELDNSMLLAERFPAIRHILLTHVL